MLDEADLLLLCDCSDFQCVLCVHFRLDHWEVGGLGTRPVIKICVNGS